MYIFMYMEKIGNREMGDFCELERLIVDKCRVLFQELVIDTKDNNRNFRFILPSDRLFKLHLF